MTTASAGLRVLTATGACVAALLVAALAPTPARAAAAISVDPPSFDFGDAPHYAPRMSKEFTFTNTGDASIQISGARFVDASSGALFGTQSTGADPQRCGQRTLNPGDSCKVVVIADPTPAWGTGRKSASLTLTTFAPGVTVPVVPLSIQLFLPAQLSADPAQIAFGKVAVGSSSAAKTVTVTNTGGWPTKPLEPALIAEAVLRDDPENDWMFKSFSLGQDTCSGRVVPVGGRCTAQVRFSPVQAGSPSSIALFVQDGGHQARAVVPLSGTGQQPRSPAKRPLDARALRLVAAKTSAVRHGRVAVRCKLDRRALARCVVRAYAGRVRVGSGQAAFKRVRQGTVQVKLTARGMRLARRAGGVALSFRAVATTAAHKRLTDAGRSRAVVRRAAPRKRR